MVAKNREKVAKEREMVITPSIEFGQGEHYHRPDGDTEQAIPRCRKDTFPEGTRYMSRGNAIMWDFTACQHVACFGEVVEHDAEE